MDIILCVPQEDVAVFAKEILLKSVSGVINVYINDAFLHTMVTETEKKLYCGYYNPGIYVNLVQNKAISKLKISIKNYSRKSFILSNTFVFKKN
jgi:hypothetical protein